MTGQHEIADLEQRRRALDPERSFIVQAPAGSGKTELLIQRYLVLLSRVQCPEEIVAITFTRRAAAEMHKRVLDALEGARRGEVPREAHRELTWRLAVAVLERDRLLGWGLGENGARLRIQTIDALCASLTRQMPVLATFGAQPLALEDARWLYRSAARATLALLEEKDARYAQAASDVERLLAHLDNDSAAACDLIAGMLERRDGWLTNLGRALDREALEAALAAVRRDAMLRARRFTPAGEAAELLALAGYAAENLAATGAESAIRECADLAALPGSSEADLHAWRGLAELLLTAQGEWRRAAIALIGFPAGTGKGRDKDRSPKDWKQRHAALITRLSGGDDLRAALDALRRLPPARYAEDQWDALGAIVRLLPYAVAELKIAFAERGNADFVEIAQGALAALGDAQAPTDLMLALDHRIHHILVDEFQDTSVVQFDLLEKLTAGWGDSGEKESGRSLFLVGDPMQSIYRFREAQVGLYLKARSDGIGQVRLEPISLTANFRAQAGIVEWVNHAFSVIMPRAEEAASGAVPYSPCVPVHAATSDALQVHAFFDGDVRGEAQRVAELVAAARAEDPEGSVAILVRSRTHLERIIPQLKMQALSFRAIEIDVLGQRQVVQDLLALTRALVHPGDRIAWLAVLRAPWCGLTLAELHALCGVDDSAARRRQDRAREAEAGGQLAFEGFETRADADRIPGDRIIWDLLNDDGRLAVLNSGGRSRVERLRAVLAPAVSGRRRAPLRACVEATWLALGGPACVQIAGDLEDAEAYLDYLEQAEEAGDIADLAAFEEGLAGLHALPDPQTGPEAAVQIMTIHKAKGLEFDTVIVPGLGRQPHRRDARLFLWAAVAAEGLSDAEKTSARHANAQLLVAPIKEAGTDSDPIYDYLVRLEAERESHEDARLIYVAATRAKRHLHLLGDARLQTDGASVEARRPAAGSLLARLWPAVERDFAEAARTVGPGRIEMPEEGGAGAIDQDLRRLPADWVLPQAPRGLPWSAPPAVRGTAEDIEFSWVGESARHVGSVVHRWLRRIADDRMQGWGRKRVDQLRAAFRTELAAFGVPGRELAAAAERVAEALGATLDDPRGKWLLGPQRDARNEYRLTVADGGAWRDLQIDRTFTDIDGTRWIVDYKTSRHEGGDKDGFLDSERSRYAAQLERYARAFGGDGPIRLGLYFPLISGWRDWECGC